MCTGSSSATPNWVSSAVQSCGSGRRFERDKSCGVSGTNRAKPELPFKGETRFEDQSLIPIDGERAVADVGGDGLSPFDKDAFTPKEVFFAIRRRNRKVDLHQHKLEEFLGCCTWRC